MINKSKMKIKFKLFYWTYRFNHRGESKIQALTYAYDKILMEVYDKIVDADFILNNCGTIVELQTEKEIDKS